MDHLKLDIQRQKEQEFMPGWATQGDLSRKGRKREGREKSYLCMVIPYKCVVHFQQIPPPLYSHFSHPPPHEILLSD
jgi:hypothetical protein